MLNSSKYIRTMLFPVHFYPEFNLKISLSCHFFFGFHLCVRFDFFYCTFQELSAFFYFGQVNVFLFQYLLRRTMAHKTNNMISIPCSKRAKNPIKSFFFKKKNNKNLIWKFWTYKPTEHNFFFFISLFNNVLKQILIHLQENS